MSFSPSPACRQRNVYFLRQQIIHEPPPPAVEESSVGAAPSLLEVIHENKSRFGEFSSLIVQSHALTLIIHHIEKKKEILKWELSLTLF